MTTIERQFRVAALALNALERELQAVPNLLDKDLERRDVRGCRQDLERTFVIRLFAEFEGALRVIYTRLRQRPALVQTKASVLMRNFASAMSVPNGVLVDADDVREFRNDLVHEASSGLVFPLRDCRSRLSTLLSYAPRSLT